MVLYGAEGLTSRAQAYRLLAQAVRLHWGLEALPELARGERGKPYFPALPHCCFNLSHSGAFALCALSERPVGVDIQVLRPSWSPRLVERSCSPAERAWLASRADGPADFAALWACKESAAKESGRGLPYPPARLEVPLPRSGLPFRPRDLYRLEGRLLRVYRGETWRAAVCGWETPPESIRWLELSDESGCTPPRP